MPWPANTRVSIITTKDSTFPMPRNVDVPREYARYKNSHGSILAPAFEKANCIVNNVCKAAQNGAQRKTIELTIRIGLNRAKIAVEHAVQGYMTAPNGMFVMLPTLAWIMSIRHQLL